MGLFQELVRILEHQKGLGISSGAEKRKKWKMMME